MNDIKLKDATPHQIGEELARRELTFILGCDVDSGVEISMRGFVAKMLMHLEME